MVKIDTLIKQHAAHVKTAKEHDAKAVKMNALVTAIGGEITSLEAKHGDLVRLAGDENFSARLKGGTPSTRHAGALAEIGGQRKILQRELLNAQDASDESASAAKLERLLGKDAREAVAHLEFVEARDTFIDAALRFNSTFAAFSAAANRASAGICELGDTIADSTGREVYYVAPHAPEAAFTAALGKLRSLELSES